MEIEIDCHDLNIDNKLKELTNLNIQLQSIREDKLKGHQIRSRYQHIKEWEKPSKYFLNLEKKIYLNKNIAELKLDNEETITNPNKIIKLQCDFYSNLFKTTNSTPDSNSRYSHFHT